MSEEKKLPHDSAYVHSSTKGRHWYHGFVSLQEKESGRAEFIIIALLLIFAVFGGSFFGYVVQTQAVNPPKQVLGICPPPAYIIGSQCLQSTTTIDAQGNSHVIVQPAGTIVGALTCSGNQCLTEPSP